MSKYCWVTHATHTAFHTCAKKVAKLTLSHASILTCAKWYWDRQLTSRDWKYRMTEYQSMQFYLHWILNKIIRNLKRDQSYRNIEPCDFQVSRFNCMYWPITWRCPLQYPAVVGLGPASSHTAALQMAAPSHWHASETVTAVIKKKLLTQNGFDIDYN